MELNKNYLHPEGKREALFLMAGYIIGKTLEDFSQKSIFTSTDLRNLSALKKGCWVVETTSRNIFDLERIGWFLELVSYPPAALPSDKRDDDCLVTFSQVERGFKVLTLNGEEIVWRNAALKIIPLGKFWEQDFLKTRDSEEVINIFSSHFPDFFLDQE